MFTNFTPAVGAQASRAKVQHNISQLKVDTTIKYRPTKQKAITEMYVNLYTYVIKDIHQIPAGKSHISLVWHCCTLKNNTKHFTLKAFNFREKRKR